MKIKQIPSDFKVKEVANLSLNGGKHSYFLLRKENWNTIDAVEAIANALGIPARRISYAGLKDKNAVTEQYISLEGISKEEIEKASIKDIRLTYLGNGNERMNTSLLLGNEFEITARELEKELKPISFVPNYFDDQRFGVNKNNHLAGKAIVQRDFRKACEIMKLKVMDNSYVNALSKSIDSTKLCFHAYQSYLFNEALADYVRKNYKAVDVEYAAGRLAFAELKSVKNFSIPLISFDTEFEGEHKNVYDNVLKEEKVRQFDFLIREMPNLIQLSPERLAFSAVSNFQLSALEDDELNQGKKKQTARFSLQKGSYATIVIKAIKSQA